MWKNRLAFAITLGGAFLVGPTSCSGEPDADAWTEQEPGSSTGSSEPEKGWNPIIPQPTPGNTPSGDKGGDDGFDPNNTCATFSARAKKTVTPADIIIAVDQSGSMVKELNWVQNQLNQFSKQIMAAQVDVRVGLIVARDLICVPPPLAAPGCGDRLPSFKYVNKYINSYNSLSTIIGTYDRYAEILRPNAKKHVIVISDDESNLTATNFDSSIRKLPTLSQYTFHAIVCKSACPFSAGVGHQYIDLVKKTGGVLGDLCRQDFKPVWNEVSKKIIATAELECSWKIPTPPAGDTLDPDKVNVEYSSAVGKKKLGRVDSNAHCDQYSNGWYYDNPSAPTMIHACPQACTNIREAEKPQVDIVLGCATAAPAVK